MRKQISMIITAAAATAVAGWAIAGEVTEVSSRGSEKLGQYEPTGEVINCLSTREVLTIEAVTETTLLVKGRGDMYVNNVSGECRGATRQDTILKFETTSPQLCKSDIITIVDNRLGTPTGSCNLGAFEKLAEKAPA